LNFIEGKIFFKDSHVKNQKKIILAFIFSNLIEKKIPEKLLERKNPKKN